MPSPFPGMDPYLEDPASWEDFHGRFMAKVCEALVPQVQPRYRATMTRVLFLAVGDEPPRQIKPDAFVIDSDPYGDVPTARSAVAVLEPPTKLLHPQPKLAERHFQVEIRDGRGEQVICAIELLSRANKDRGPNRDAYEVKRTRVMRSESHYVEIDLLRTLPRVTGVQNPPPLDYYAMVSRAEERPSVGFWPIKLRDRLPKIPVPLRSPDPDAVLDLQAVLDATYDAARYGDYIYRGGPPEPPLEGEDADWAAAVLAEANIPVPTAAS